MLERTEVCGMCEAMLRFTAPELDAVVDAKGENENQSSCALSLWVYVTAWDRCMAAYA